MIRTVQKNLVSVNGFTLIELLIVIAILGILATVGLNSFTSSQMKSRDTRRKANLNQISQSLEIYYNDFGKYPSASTDGAIMGCGAGAINACSWGVDTFGNTTTGTVYMIKLPEDPSSYVYYYQVSGANKMYQLYTHLENPKDKSILTSITKTTECGGTCNYGVSSPNIKP